jgi:hypothetical protein
LPILDGSAGLGLGLLPVPRETLERVDLMLFMHVILGPRGYPAGAEYQAVVLRLHGCDTQMIGAVVT